MFWIALLSIGLRLLLVLFAPDLPFYAVGQCANGRCLPPGQAVSYAPYSVGNVGQWQPVTSQRQFVAGQIIGQPIPVQTRPCAANGCPVPFCGPGDCVNCPTCYVSSPAIAGKVEWSDVVGQPTKRARIVSGRCVGIWDDADQTFRVCDAAGIMGAPTKDRPADLPAAQGAGTAKPTTGADKPAAGAPSPATGQAPLASAEAQTSTPPTGLEWSQVASYNGGQPCSREGLYQVLGVEAEGGIPKDTTKPFCAFVSPDPAERKAFERAWDSATELAPWKDRIRCKVHDPEDPVLKDRDGNRTWWAEPGFYAVAADGTNPQKVELAYADPETMAGALYRVDPTFTPPSDPVASDEAADLGGVVVALGLLAGLGLLGFVTLVGAGLVAYLIFHGESDAPVVA